MTDRLTDHAAQSVTIGLIYVRSNVMWPNNGIYMDVTTAVMCNPVRSGCNQSVQTRSMLHHAQTGLQKVSSVQLWCSQRGLSEPHFCNIVHIQYDDTHSPQNRSNVFAVSGVTPYGSSLL